MKQSPFVRGNVDKPRTKRFHWNTIAMVFTGFGLVILSLFVVNKKSQYVNLGYEVTTIREENRVLRERQLQLRAEKERLASPDRIYRESVEQGLAPIPAGQRYMVRVLEKEPSRVDEQTLMAMRTETSVP